MISLLARRRAKDLDERRREDAEERGFALAYRICPRCAGPLRRSVLSLRCRPCKLKWRDYSSAYDGPWP